MAAATWTDVLAAFGAAHEAAKQARGHTREQRAGNAEPPPGSEYWIGEADARWDALLRLASLDVVEQVVGEGVASEYMGRRRRVVNKTEPLAGDWRESVGRVDWSRGAA
jgi:hypothetical protein